MQGRTWDEPRKIAHLEGEPEQDEAALAQDLAEPGINGRRLRLVARQASAKRSEGETLEAVPGSFRTAAGHCEQTPRLESGNLSSESLVQHASGGSGPHASNGGTVGGIDR